MSDAPPERVETRFFTCGSDADPFPLFQGGALPGFTLAYETWGELNEARDNAILVFHALSGSQHVAGHNPEIPGLGDRWIPSQHTGWWDAFVGPGKVFDTRRHFVICANYLGGCYGSTGPASPDPRTGKPWGGTFPVIRFRDMVETQRRLVEHLGVQRLAAVTGGSLGGTLSCLYACLWPDDVERVITFGTGLDVPTLQRVQNFEQIFAIEQDPNFRGGDYYDGPPPVYGLALARIIAHKTYISLQTMERRARREIIQPDDHFMQYRLNHVLESYMNHQGLEFTKRFDANAYLRILEAWQRFDFATEAGAASPTEAEVRILEETARALRTDLDEEARRAVEAEVRARVLRELRIRALSRGRSQRHLVVTIDSDVSFYPDQQDNLEQEVREAGVEVERATVHSAKGHDSFLTEPDLYREAVTRILADG